MRIYFQCCYYNTSYLKINQPEFATLRKNSNGVYEFLGELDSSSLSPKEEEIRDKLNGIEWRDGVKYVSTPPEDKWPLLHELMMCRLQKDE